MRNRTRFAALLLPAIAGIAMVSCYSSEKSGEAEETGYPASATMSAGRAAANIQSSSGSQVTGVAHFTVAAGEVSLHVRVENAPPGTHAVHLHAIGDCSAPDATSAGDHWNPTAEDHGRWGMPPFHRGDIGNLEVGPDGVGEMTLSTDLWTIGGDSATDVVGRAIVVHGQGDDFVTQPTGGAGDRIGCGVVAAEA